jgi:hypothetical protein
MRKKRRRALRSNNYLRHAGENLMRTFSRFGLLSASILAAFGAEASAAASTAIESRREVGEVEVFVMLSPPAVLPSVQEARRNHVASLTQVAASARVRARMAQDAMLNEARTRGIGGVELKRFDRLIDAVLIRSSREHLAALRDLPGVEGVFENVQVHASLHESVPLTGADRVWPLLDAQGNSLTGVGMRVAVIDTGIDYTHPDLGGCLGRGCKVAGGWDFVNDDADPMDDHMHGTHVAGIVAANGTVRGMAPDATLFAYKVLDANGSGYSSAIISGIETAIDPDGDPTTQDGAHVLNLSLGGTGSPTDPMCVAVDNAVAAGAVVVIAAGNSGPSYYSVGSPGVAEQALTVASSTKADAISDFSSRGPVTAEPGYLPVKPEITAPGSDIHSTYLDRGFETLSGTSMAAPHVAGAAALLRQKYPSLPPVRIKSLIVHSAVPLGEDAYTQGGGRLDVPRAIANGAVTVDVAIVNHGWMTSMEENWVGPVRELTFTNHGDAPVTLTFAMDTAGLPAGTQWELPSAITLAPGASQVVANRLRVDNRVFPFPTSAADSFDAAIRVSADNGAQLRIPVVFHKSAELRLSIDNPDQAWGRGLVFSDDGRVRRSFTISNERTSARNLLLPPGTYHGVFAFTPARKYVVREAMTVPDAGTTLAVSSDSARHVVRLPAYRRSDASVIPADELRGLKNLIEIRHLASGVVMTDGLVDARYPQAWVLSDTSDAFEIEGASVVEDETADPADRQLYHSTFRTLGAAGALLLPEDSRALRIGYDGAESAPGGVRPIVWLGSVRSGLAVHENLVVGDSPFTAPFHLTFHMTPDSPDAQAASMRQIFIQFKDRDSGRAVAATSLFQPAPQSSAQGGFEFIERGEDPPFSDGEARVGTLAPSGPEPADDADFGTTPIFFTRELRYHAAFEAAVLDAPDALQAIYQGAFRDAFQNKNLKEDIEYQLRVDGALVDEGTLAGTYPVPWTYLPELPELEEHSVVEFTGETGFTLEGRAGTSHVQVINRTSGSRAPYLRSLRILDARGRPTGQVAAGAYRAYRIALDASDDRGLAEAGLEIDLGDGWQALALTRQDGVYVASLPPLPVGGGAVALRATLRDDDRAGAGNSLVNTISPAFVVQPAVIAVDPARIDFGAVQTGSSSVERSATISNPGTAELEISGIEAPSAPFSRVGGSCGESGAVRLAPGGSCTLVYVFAPTTQGTTQENLLLQSGTQDIGAVQLQGTGTVPTEDIFASGFEAP